MDYFLLLPEGCVCDILSFTSPKDVVISSAISRGFNSAAESDFIWVKFLPDDYEDIISRYVSPRIYPSKKELYFSLCDFPVLMDGGKLSFSLDKKTGKKCFMISARELAISWGVDTPWYWEWISHPDSRFSEVAHLKGVSWLDIRGTIGTQILSKRTKYVVYLVFKLAKDHDGLEIANAFVRFVNRVSDKEAEERASVVSLVGKRVRRRKRNVKRPRKRVDGWMEIELGNFINDTGDDGDVEARLMEITRLHGKGGLIVQGIEFRPE
nr:S-locus inhibitor protein [Solanum andreanum]WOH22319.1 S-locus inhibitor protein [Solanum brevicaule]WOH22386.1 S-locus inhibitor protein [Solanum hjertingii]WOH22398.1 S-locus inhibitor protein [Solanum hougasii]WOH22421.1 S-locus inhibitor protein [Solanum iopetalum]WOH22475.1 S-locus inhibitor protein [Solanum schenckii]WOH22482.1 S-locus inhibitor protein [Solanum stoloniferum]WOH22500.1 S-locus inhibitor protein [Solanum verrucosum]